MIASTNYFNSPSASPTILLKVILSVINPASEVSYTLRCLKLNNALLLNPQNEEAIYMLVLIKIEQSDYNEAKELINKFNLVCKSFCPKKKEIESKFKKLNPENAKDNN